MTYTYTYVILEVSPAAYDEIAAKLKAADYNHVFHKDTEQQRAGVSFTAPPVIDMNGLALRREG